MGFVRARVSLAIVRATALCIRGSRKSVNGVRFALDDGAGMCLHFLSSLGMFCFVFLGKMNINFKLTIGLRTELHYINMLMYIII